MKPTVKPCKHAWLHLTVLRTCRKGSLGLHWDVYHSGHCRHTKPMGHTRHSQVGSRSWLAGDQLSCAFASPAWTNGQERLTSPWGKRFSVWCFAQVACRPSGLLRLHLVGSAHERQSWDSVEDQCSCRFHGDWLLSPCTLEQSGKHGGHGLGLHPLRSKCQGCRNPGGLEP